MECVVSTTVFPDHTDTIVQTRALSTLDWNAVIAGVAVASATGFFLILLGAGVGLVLIPAAGSATFLTLGAIYVLAAQAFGFAAGGHIAGRLMRAKTETRREEEFRAGIHGLVVWASTIIVALILLALATAAGSSFLRMTPMASQDTISAYWADLLLHPYTPHAMARGQDLSQDKAEAARVLIADLAPNSPTHNENRADLIRLAGMDGGLSYTEAVNRTNLVETNMRHQLDTMRKLTSYASLWLAFALLFGAVLAMAAAISARWQEEKISFSMTRRY